MKLVSEKREVEFEDYMERMEDSGVLVLPITRTHLRNLWDYLYDRIEAAAEGREFISDHRDTYK